MSAHKRLLRVLKYAFLVSGLLLILVTVRIPAKTRHPINPPIELIVAALALLDLAFGTIGRPLLTRLAALNTRAVQSNPLNQWVTLNIASLGAINGCILLAMVLHFMGGRANLVGLLFGAALLTLFFWSPNSPPAAENAEHSSVIEPTA